MRDHTALSQVNGSKELPRITGGLTRLQKLGIYLIIVGLLEAGAFLLDRIPFPMPPLPPHGGLGILVLGELVPTPGGWLFFLNALGSACWPIVLGVLFVLGRRPLKIYIAAEVALSAPNLWVGIDLARFGGGHVFTREHGLSLLVFFFFFSAIPLLWATWASKLSPSRQPT